MPSRGRKLLNRNYWLCVSLLLAILASTQVISALRETATWDEPVHLTAGYSYWITGTYRMAPENPPLAKMICALPLYLFYHPVLDTSSPHWLGSDFVYFANLFLYRNTTGPDVLLFSARLMNIALTGALAAYFAWWMRRRAGPAAGLFSLALLVFDPNLIAHGRYVTTDFAAAAFLFTTATLWIEYLLDGSRRWLILTGLSLGLACATKFSTLCLIPILLIMFWWRRRSIRELAMAVAVLAGLGLLVLTAVYWPEARHPGSLPPLATSIVRKGAAAPLLSFAADRLHLPAFSYLVGLDRLSEFDAVGQPSYLLGQFSNHGSRLYFPIAFAVKTPAAILLAMVLSVVVARQAGQRFLILAVLFPAAVYFAFAVSGRINIGIRHLLPVYPLLYAGLGMVLMNCSYRRFALLVPLMVAIESAAIFPNYLTFFNVFAGGPPAGPKYLLDSNLDWGQAAGQLGRYMRRQRIPRVCLSFFGNVDLPRYGVYSDPLPPRTDPATLDCVAAISATPLYGLYVGPESYAAFRTLRPTAVIGNSIYLYDLRKGHR